MGNSIPIKESVFTFFSVSKSYFYLSLNRRDRSVTSPCSFNSKVTGRYYVSRPRVPSSSSISISKFSLVNQTLTTVPEKWWVPLHISYSFPTPSLRFLRVVNSRSVSSVPFSSVIHGYSQVRSSTYPSSYTKCYPSYWPWTTYEFLQSIIIIPLLIIVRRNKYIIT